MNSPAPEQQPSPDQPNSSQSPNEEFNELIDILLDSETAETVVQESFPDEVSNSDEASNSIVAAEPEIAVEIEAEPELTLEETVAYKAFLRQTVSLAPAGSDPLMVNTLEEIADLDTEQATTEELAEAVNSLIPLIVELLQFKLNNSREGILQTVRPVIDQLIGQRIGEDRDKMALVLAEVLPSAISEEIKLDPAAIAKAIAPEVALSIQEQIRLDEDAIPETLGPEMGKAIKAQIELERDAMVDALYPVIGSTISKYMVEVVQEINQKIDQTLSPAGIKRKFQARLQGVSEAELILKESIGCHVNAIFLIHKDSGLVIKSLQVPGSQPLDADMLAGMLTAIRSFANDCITSGSELDSIDYGGWQIPLEVAGYCYLAAIVAGEPSKILISKMRHILSEIVLQYDQEIEDFDGDAASLPEGINVKLEQLLELNTAKSESDSPKESSKSSASPVLLWLLIFIFSLILLPWGLFSYRAQRANTIEQVVTRQLDSAPELSVYRLEPTVQNGTLTLRGRVPSNYLLQQAGSISQTIAESNNLALDNQIVAVQVPLNPMMIKGEIDRLTDLFNLQSDVIINCSYGPEILKIQGFIAQESSRQAIAQAFGKIPGIKQIIFEVSHQLPLIEQRLYFHSGSSEVNFADNFSKIDAVKQIMAQFPQLHLKLKVHSDGQGAKQLNQQLSEARCRNVKSALVKRGVASQRLEIDCLTAVTPPYELDYKSSWFNRYVSFEPFVPTNPIN